VKTKVKIAAVAAVLLTVMFRLAMAEDAKKEEVKENKYLGDKQCIACHKDLDDSVKMWEASKHAKAYETLATDAAKKFSSDPQKDPACLQCHVTGFGKEGGFAVDLKDDKKETVAGVTCESCHGAGQKYLAIFAKAKAKKEAPDKKELAAAGLITPDEKKCLECHNEKSPTFDKEKPFKFDEMYKAIKHAVKAEAETK